MRQTTLSYDRKKVTKYLLTLGWSHFDARCLMRTKLTDHEKGRVESGKISNLQRKLIYDDSYRREMLLRIVVIAEELK